MDESDEALSIDCTEEEYGGYSSENWTEQAGNRSLKLQGKKDRISALPDSLIQHIISFLPSTKQAIRTGILSKRWLNQWSCVPILIFKSSGKNDENFSQFIDRTLTMHDCSKLKKFHVQYGYHLKHDPQLTPKIRFATRKHVEELILRLNPIFVDDSDSMFKLPEFLCVNHTLVKVELTRCCFYHPRKPYWPSLKELKLDCSFLPIGVKALENAVLGCTSLELLELSTVCFSGNDVIASNSLKRLVIVDASSQDRSCIEISCPNLEELSIKISENLEVEFSRLPDQLIENVLSRCPLLHTLELLDVDCPDEFIIASKSLKKLVLGELPQTSDVEISCPNLEESNLLDFGATLHSIDELETKMLGQLQYVKKLEIGSSFIVVEGRSSPVLNCKCLTLGGTNFDDLLPGIICAIRSSPMLEKLVIKFPPYGRRILTLGDLRKHCWNLNETTFNCSASNLKTVRLVGLSDGEDTQKLVLNFVELLLKNSRVLENIVITLAKCGPGFVFKVSKKLLGFQRCYPNTAIELCSA